MKPIVLRGGARTDLIEIQSWYGNERTGLGKEFLTNVTSKFVAIQANPHLYPRMSRNVRRSLLDRFPYAVYYVEAREEIAILAVLHTSRKPGGWRSRL